MDGGWEKVDFTTDSNKEVILEKLALKATTKLSNI